ncbi:DUF1257 domain-containing protein [Metabacillus halosaccharovorans]|uniref:DUF1257 domain-containing protein n=1 Tax=Metabacillus halosaccharovorans TaxID=930124 RepID=UPI00203D9F2D|nr:DUF1257 domain-containing protein [Metabacillus halosaccharovorans]MCM3443103.1 DUF1257 domain-containing protein [Metabacillus halosaccharovorans]
MSIELVLIPVGIAVAHSVGSLIESHKNDRNTYKIQTVMKQQHLLQKALQQYGCEINEMNHQNYQTIVGDINIYFQQNDSGVFEAVFDKSVAKEDAVEFLDHLHSEYKYLIQQETYKRLLKQASEKGLELESEEIQQDRSIVLTFNVTN